jgi:integrase
MATLRKRGPKWQVQVRREGHPNVSKTFHLREDALKWAREQERRIDRGELVCTASLPLPSKLTLADVLSRYERDVLPTKRTQGVNERFHLRPILRHALGSLNIAQVSPASIASYRDLRLTQVSPSTVRRELGILMHALRLAKTEWGIPVPELGSIIKPSENKPRERRLTEEELSALNEALRQCRNKFVRPAFLFALATGMRRGEVLSLRWCNVDVETATAFLPITKNGHSRLVPLSPQALSVLHQLKRSTDEYVFPISANSLRLAWERVRRRAKVEDLRFHDLRHEAISRFFEQGLSVPEVSLISGHRDPRMLFRYTHLKAADIAKKLHQANAAEPSDGRIMSFKQHGHMKH